MRSPQEIDSTLEHKAAVAEIYLNFEIETLTPEDLHNLLIKAASVLKPGGKLIFKFTELSSIVGNYLDNGNADFLNSFFCNRTYKFIYDLETVKTQLNLGHFQLTNLACKKTKPYCEFWVEAKVQHLLETDALNEHASEKKICHVDAKNFKASNFVCEAIRHKFFTASCNRGCDLSCFNAFSSSVVAVGLVSNQILSRPAVVRTYELLDFLFSLACFDLIWFKEFFYKTSLSNLHLISNNFYEYALIYLYLHSKSTYVLLYPENLIYEQTANYDLAKLLKISRIFAGQLRKRIVLWLLLKSMKPDNPGLRERVLRELETLTEIQLTENAYPFFPTFFNPVYVS
ncbi:MAG: hypothetical protein NZO16_00395 [Deltaproteobacteria bacterium]|nr:hypothetical protein [Deltaproteobacteria bacterium]